MANLFDYHFGARWPEITVRKTAAIHRLLELRYDSQSRAVRLAANSSLAAILSLETGIEDDEIAPFKGGKEPF